MNTSFHLNARSLREAAAIEDDAERIDLRMLALSLWRRRRVIGGATLGACVAGWLLTFLMTPMFTARATLVLDTRTADLVSSNDGATEVSLSNPLLDTEATVLRSNVLLGRVVDTLNAETLAQLSPAAMAMDDAARQRLARINALRGALTVWREGQSYAISVSAETPDPVLSATLANAVSETYIEAQVSQRSVAVSSTTDFLLTRVAELRLSVEQAEAAVEQYKVEQFVAAGMTVDTMAQQLAELGTQLAIARADLASVTARWEPLSARLAADGIDSVIGIVSSPYIVSLREGLAQARRQDADLAVQMGPDNPARQRIAATIAQLQRDLADEVRTLAATLENDVLVAQNRVASLEGSVKELEERVAAVSRSSLELRQLEREAAALKGGYEAMLSRLNEAQTLEQFRLANARVIEQAAVPGAASSPRRGLIAGLAGVSGLTLALLAVMLTELSGAGFARSAQIEAATGYPVIGHLQRLRTGGLAEVLSSLRRDPWQPFAEQLRSLRTTLTLRAGPQGLRSILLTSAVPDEGKTTAALALAFVEARANRSCVLLDFDIRRASIGGFFAYDPPGGGDLDLLLSGGCTLDDALFQGGDMTFPVISTRPGEVRAMESVEPEQIARLIADLRARFQTVVIDSPPLLAVSDTLQIGRFVDATVVLLRQNTTRRGALRDALRRLTDMGVTPAGVVLTMIEPRDLSANYGVVTHET